MHRLYVDETGNADMRASADPNHRYLSLTGIIMDIEHVRNVATPGMNAIKREILHEDPDEPIVFHRKDIMNRNRPFHLLRDPDTAARFDAALLRYLADCRYTVITADLPP
jgi:hypothetical protein